MLWIRVDMDTVKPSWLIVICFNTYECIGSTTICIFVTIDVPTRRPKTPENTVRQTEQVASLTATTLLIITRRSLLVTRPQRIAAQLILIEFIRVIFDKEYYMRNCIGVSVTTLAIGFILASILDRYCVQCIYKMHEHCHREVWGRRVVQLYWQL